MPIPKGYEEVTTTIPAGYEEIPKVPTGYEDITTGIPEGYEEVRGVLPFMQRAFVEPAKTFYGGVLKSFAGTAGMLDFYSDKVANAVGAPETKNSVFEYLRDNWDYYGDRLIKEGISPGLIQKVYKGLGVGAGEVSKLMAVSPALKAFTLPTMGAISGFQEAGIPGAVTGASTGALFRGILRGLHTMPWQLKYPTAFGVGVAATPGEIDERITSGTVLTALSLGKSPSMRQFRETLKYSPLIRPPKAEGIYTDLFNRFQPIENIVKKAKELGLNIKPGENPTLRARAYLGLGNRVRTTLEYNTHRLTPEGRIQITGEGLNPILSHYDRVSPERNLGLRKKDLRSYLIARHQVTSPRELVTRKQLKQGQKTLTNLANKYKGNIGHLRETATRLYGFQERVLQQLVDSGVMKPEQFLDWRNRYPSYIPMDRVLEDIEPTIIPRVARRFTRARKPFGRRRFPSELVVADPFESIIKNTYRVMDTAERNIVARGVTQLARSLPQEIQPLNLRLPPGARPKKNAIEVYEDGVRRFYKVSPNLYQAMTGLNETSLPIWVKWFSSPTRWLRTGATITPEFMLRNPMRDQLVAAMQSKVGFVPFVDTIGAMADMLGKSNSYKDWLRSGGAYSGFVELSRPQLRLAYKELTKPRSRRLLSKLNIISTAGDISQFFERATRLGVYKKAIRKGYSPIEAGFESREATVDFARRGAKTKDINAMVAFLNAQLQGADKSIRTALADPVGFAMKGSALITIPSLLLYLRNRNDPDFKEIPRWQKDLFWVTKAGPIGSDAPYVRIPKPFTYGQVFGSLPERFFEYLDTQDKSAFDRLGKSLIESLSPVSGEPLVGLFPTALKPLIENRFNWNFFREANIVPLAKKKLLPEEQYGRYTTEAAKVLGKTIKQSPAKIENLIRGWFGGTGMYGLEVADMLVRSIKKNIGEPIEPQRPKELADIPLVKGFVVRPGQSESIRKFYDRMEKVNQAYNTQRALLKEGRKEDAKAITERYPQWRYGPVLTTYSKMLATLRKQIDRVIDSTTLTEEQKRERIRVIEKRMTTAAQKANALLDKLKRK